MLWLRKIIFYIFSLLYLIICPLIVLRMLGFVFNPLTHHLEKTGLVYISTNPPDAAVYIDGRLAHQATPTVIRDLTPGSHFIRLQLNGYNDWERTIPIVGKKATVLANTLLIPEEWPIKKISIRPYENITFAADDILVATNPLLRDIDIFNTTQGTGKSLFSQNSVYAAGTLVSLFHEPQSPYILLETNVNAKDKFLWINVKEEPPVIEDISDLFTATPILVTWDNADNGDIIVFYPKNISRINIKDKTILPQDAASLPQGLLQDTRNIQDKFLINDKNDLLIREDRWIRIYPKESFGKPRVYTIAGSRLMTNMYFEEKNGELFYLDDSTGALSTVQVLPYHSILNLPIPDALKIKIPSKESII
jgi:hypothetical protein